MSFIDNTCLSLSSLEASSKPNAVPTDLEAQTYPLENISLSPDSKTSSNSSFPFIDEKEIKTEENKNNKNLTSQLIQIQFLLVNGNRALYSFDSNLSIAQIKAKIFNEWPLGIVKLYMDYWEFMFVFNFTSYAH